MTTQDPHNSDRLGQLGERAREACRLHAIIKASHADARTALEEGRWIAADRALSGAVSAQTQLAYELHEMRRVTLDA